MVDHGPCENRIIRTDSQLPTQDHPVRSLTDLSHHLPIHKMSDSRESALKLSLERLYKDDLGRPIPTLFDITPDGRYVFEPCASTILGLAVV